LIFGIGQNILTSVNQQISGSDHEESHQFITFLPEDGGIITNLDGSQIEVQTEKHPENENSE
jgi:hypothetical protein